MKRRSLPLLSSPLGIAHTLSGDEPAHNPTTIRIQRERPILMCGEMVRATLADIKTQTRRCGPITIATPVEAWRTDGHGTWYGVSDLATSRGLGVPATPFIDCPYGAPGDRLWVKETFSAHGAFGTEGRVIYRADLGDDSREPHGQHWKPSIFMPRKASRLTLEITAILIERLNAISEADAKAEGSPVPTGRRGSYPAPWATAKPGPVDYRDSYRLLWEKINGRGSWKSNPWVWVITFRRVK